MKAALADFAPDGVMHLAAESHVDRSIDGPATFIETNIVGTFVCSKRAGLLARAAGGRRRVSAFMHVSTDEVYGSLGADGRFSENNALRAEFAVFGVQGGFGSSGASLASHLGLPVVDHQLLQQLRPLSVSRKAHSADDPERARRQAAAGLRRRREVRDWLYVEDHAARCCCMLERGDVGESYNVGGDSERPISRWCEAICALLDELAPDAVASPARASDQIRQGPAGPRSALCHRCDARSRANSAGGRSENFESGLRKTVRMVSRATRLVASASVAAIAASGWARLWRASAMAQAHERHHFRRRHRHAALSGDARRQQAAPAGLRQADDLLSAVDADAGRHPRNSDHHDAATIAAVPARCSATAASGASRSPMPCSPSPTALPQAFIIGRDFVGADQCGADPRRQIFYGHGLPEAAAPRPLRGQTGATVFGYRVTIPSVTAWSNSIAIGKVLSHRGEAEAAEVELGGHRTLFLRQRRGGHRRARSSLRRAANWRSPTSTAPISNAAHCMWS